MSGTLLLNSLVSTLAVSMMAALMYTLRNKFYFHHHSPIEYGVAQIRNFYFYIILKANKNLVMSNVVTNAARFKKYDLLLNISNINKYFGASSVTTLYVIRRNPDRNYMRSGC